MLLNKNTKDNYTSRQLKLPLEIEKIIDASDSVYTFCEIMDHIDLSRYFVEKDSKTGRPRCDAQKLLKVILFAFMENGFCSLREIEKLCRTDIRYMYLLDDMKAPSFATFGNFIRDELTTTIEHIFNDVNAYIFEADHVDLDHYTYIDGTKIEANANKYTWVWKKSCIKNRDKMFANITELKPYASDMECFVPLMEKFNAIYGHYPKYPVADAGCGSYNNYLYCEEHGMEKYMKFTMFEKETKDSKYHNNPYRIDNFDHDENGTLICPNGKRFIHKCDKHVKGNKYGRTEEIYECEDCTGCPYKNECCKKVNFR